MEQQVVSAIEFIATGDKNKVKQGEEFLRGQQQVPDYPGCLLKAFSSNSPAVRQHAAILLKNHVKTFWKAPPEESMPIPVRDQLKELLVHAMMTTEPAIQRQLSETLTIISTYDFPEKWPNLLKSLVPQLATPTKMLDVLKTIHSILKRYRHEMNTDFINGQLRLILPDIQGPHLELTQYLGANLQAASTSKDNLKFILSCLNYSFKIFYDLVSVDLPEYYEDHLAEWCAEFHRYLTFTTTFPEIIGDEDDTKPPLLANVQTSICNNLVVFIQKYEEEISPHLQQFVNDVWVILLSLSTGERHDRLAGSAMSVLTNIATSVNHTMFEGENVLKSICENIVIKNLEFREMDKDLFKDNGVEYIRRDIEGSDTDTRRRAACEVVTGLRKSYEERVTTIFAPYINALLEQYNKDWKKNWKSKDAALYLLAALAISGNTESRGATNTNAFIPIVEFFTQHVLPELTGKLGSSLIIKADCLKFATTFRQQLPKESYGTLITVCIELLKSTNFVVHSYAAICIDKLLSVREIAAGGAENSGNPTMRFQNNDLKPFLQPALAGLFGVLRQEASKENNYVMSAITRVLVVASGDVAPFATEVLTQIQAKLDQVYKNPSNPEFNHQMFESLAVLIRSLCVANASFISAFENALFPIFNGVVSEEITEFAPYVFQIMSYLLELRPTGVEPVPALYAQLMPKLLKHDLYAIQGNIPPLSRLLCSYIEKDPLTAGQVTFLQPLLGVFLFLLSSSISEKQAFDLLTSISLYISPEALSPFIDNIWGSVLKRLSISKVVRTYKSFIPFVSNVVCKYGPNAVANQLSKLQPDIIFDILDKIWVPNVDKVVGYLERKITALASVRILTELERLPNNVETWKRLLLATVMLMENVDVRTTAEAFGPGLVDQQASNVRVGEGTGDEVSGNVSYSRLVYASRIVVDQNAQVNPKKALWNALNQMMSQNTNMLVVVKDGLTNQTDKLEPTKYLQAFESYAGL